MDDEIQFLLFWEKEFKAIRLMGSYFIPTTWNIKCDLTPTMSITNADMNIVISKFNYWFDNYINNSLFISAQDEWAADFVELGTENNIVLCPDDPNDDLISILIQCKLNALSQGKFDIEYVDIKATPSGGLNTALIAHASQNLPPMEEWIGEHAWFSQPWWNRDDASTVDDEPPEGANLNIPPSYAESLKFIEDAFIDIETVQPAPIIKHEFRPQIITGGLSEQPKKRRKRKDSNGKES
jgi:hypothetical protein